MSDQRHLVLVGLMAAGKTTVGQRCAQRLGRPFVDTDDLVEAVSGATVAELFATEGEAGFRARERAAVADACASPVATVIACGGGAVLDPENRRTLRASGFVVWLRATPEVLAERVAHDAKASASEPKWRGGGGYADRRRRRIDRPLLGPTSAAITLERLAGTRAAAYEAVADVEVDTGGLTVPAVAEAVVEVYARCAG